MLTPVQVLERLLTRLEKRMEALQRVKPFSASSWMVFRWSSANWKWSRTICAVRCATWKSESRIVYKRSLRPRVGYPLSKSPGVAGQRHHGGSKPDQLGDNGGYDSSNAGRAPSSHSRSGRASAIAGQFDKLSRVSRRAFR